MTAPRKAAAQPPLDDPTPTEIHPKVAAASVAMPVSVVLVWLATLMGLDMPAEVAAGLAALLATLAAYLKTAPPWVRRSA